MRRSRRPVRRAQAPGALWVLLGLALAACAGQASEAAGSAISPTAFIETRVAEVLTQSASGPTATAPPAATAALEFATVTPISGLALTAEALPTMGATVTPEATLEPTLTPGTPCPNPACVAGSEHWWLARPIPEGFTIYVERSYAYGATQQGLREPHHGVEFFNRQGTPVLAAAAGTVVVAGNDTETAYGPATRFYGNLVVVELDRTQNGQPVFTLYAHLSEVNVTVGETVNTGDLLGAVGQTGVAIGPHLHFEVRVGKNSYAHTRNPELWFKPLLGARNTPYGVLAGRVEALDGQKLANLTVVIRPVKVGEPTRAKYITTYVGDSVNGDEVLLENFAIGDLPAGTYSVAVNTTKFYEQTVVIEPGRLAWVAFTVKPPAAAP